MEVNPVKDLVYQNEKPIIKLGNCEAISFLKYPIVWQDLRIFSINFKMLNVVYECRLLLA